MVGIGYEELVKKIEDRRDIPSYGYDYLSFNAPGHERYIEVKSVGRDTIDSFFPKMNVLFPLKKNTARIITFTLLSMVRMECRAIF